MRAVLTEVGARISVPVENAELLRFHSNALFAIRPASLVIRIATNPDALQQVISSVRVTRWLDRLGFSCVVPAEISGYPCMIRGHVVSLWRYMDTTPEPPTGAELGQLLRDLHARRPPHWLSILTDPLRTSGRRTRRRARPRARRARGARSRRAPPREAARAGERVARVLQRLAYGRRAQRLLLAPARLARAARVEVDLDARRARARARGGAARARPCGRSRAARRRGRVARAPCPAASRRARARERGEDRGHRVVRARQPPRPSASSSHEPHDRHAVLAEERRAARRTRPGGGAGGGGRRRGRARSPLAR